MPDTWQAEDVVRIRSHGLADNLFSEVDRAQVACKAGLSADRLRVKLEPPHVTRIPDRPRSVRNSGRRVERLRLGYRSGAIYSAGAVSLSANIETRSVRGLQQLGHCAIAQRDGATDSGQRSASTTRDSEPEIYRPSGCTGVFDDRRRRTCTTRGVIRAQRTSGLWLDDLRGRPGRPLRLHTEAR